MATEVSKFQGVGIVYTEVSSFQGVGIEGTYKAAMISYEVLSQLPF